MVSPCMHNHRLEAAADAASERCRSRRVSKDHSTTEGPEPQVNYDVFSFQK